jgi:hypothetical protein
MNSVTVGGITLSRELIEQAYALLHPVSEPGPDVVSALVLPPVPEAALTEEAARDFARRTCCGADIAIKKNCQHCGLEFGTFLYGGLISPRYCSRSCVDAAVPRIAPSRIETRSERQARKAQRQKNPKMVAAAKKRWETRRRTKKGAELADAR